MGFSALLAKEFVHCILPCTSPVAVRLRYIHSSTLGSLTRSLRVINHVLQRFAGDCKPRISKPLSLLRVALCCTVLRSRWYQSGIRTSDRYSPTAGPMACRRTLYRHSSGRAGQVEEDGLVGVCVPYSPYSLLRSQPQAGRSAACLFLLQGVGDSLIQRHRPTLVPRLLPCSLPHP